MRFGVPDAKLEKWMIDRRVEILEAEGIRFEYGVEVGTDVDATELADSNDAVVIAIGSRVERDFEAPGRELDGVHFAMDYLYQRNRWVAASQGHPAREPEPGAEITAAGKHVVVIGGGDTGMDCISNANREGALSATLLDVYPELPSDGRYPDITLAAGAEALVHHLRARRGRRAALRPPGDRPRRRRRPGQRPWPGDGSPAAPRAPRAGRRQRVHDPGRAGIGRDRLPAPGPRRRVAALGLDTDRRGNVAAKLFQTSRSGVWAAGDARVGQSLIVTAIAEGRRCARAVDRMLREPGAEAATPAS